MYSVENIPKVGDPALMTVHVVDQYLSRPISGLAYEPAHFFPTLFSLFLPKINEPARRLSMVLMR